MAGAVFTQPCGARCHGRRRVTRLCLVTALPSEARPLVDHFRLVPVVDAPLRTWRSDDIALVVGGMGMAAAAAATGYLAGLTGAPRACAWVNVGIAGHSSLSRGDVVVVDRCVHQASGRTWYPSLPLRTVLPRSACITVGAVETAFSEDALFDMECAGFLDAAGRFAWLDLVHSVKVVSDGPGRDTSDLDRETVMKLVAGAMPRLVGDFIEPLLACAAPVAADAMRPDLSAWTARWHFTASNTHRLREVVDDYVAANGGRVPAPASFDDCRSAAEVLARLRRQVNAPGAATSRC